MSHSLGVVDQQYVDKTGDAQATLGRVITLTSVEVLDAAQIAERLVKSFFGAFLS
jgi:hypothetical protein